MSTKDTAASKDAAPVSVADMSIEVLERALSAAKGKFAVESFTDAKAEAEKSGFTTAIHPAHNGGSPALRIDY